MTVEKYEKALLQIAELGRVGVWPAWEMKAIAEEALGSEITASLDVKHNRALQELGA